MTTATRRPLLLVTGGAGFIGSRVVVAALDNGWRVRVLDSYRSDVHHAKPAAPQGVDVVHADVTDAAAVDRALEGVDAVSHQAAKVGLGVDLSDAPDYVASNDLGTAVLLAAMARHRITRLVLASSMVVYGEGLYLGATGPVRPAARSLSDLDAGIFDPRDAASGALLEPGFITEDSMLDPRSVYAATKLAQEHLAAVWARASSGRVAVLRYHNVYGPGMPRDTPYAGVAAIFRSALECGESPRVFEDGGQRRDFVHVDDVAAANVAAIEWTLRRPEGAVRAFNIGSGTVTTILEVAQALTSVVGGAPPVITGEYRSGDVRHITASSDRARAELDWSPAVDLATGMRDFATARLRA